MTKHTIWPTKCASRSAGTTVIQQQTPSGLKERRRLPMSYVNSLIGNRHWVIVPIGNGCNLAGVWKGFKEFCQLGFISKKPRTFGIQPTGSSPVVSAYKKNSTSFEPVTPKTLAGALAVGNPRNYIKASNSLRESNGVAESVTDDEILQASHCS
jgi:threonine synthase